MGDVPQKRFHGKVLVRRGDTEIHVNVFDDDKNVVYQQIQFAIAQFSGDISPATEAGRELRRAAQVVDQAAATRAAAAPTPAPKSTTAVATTRTKAANAPVCEECDQADMVELISWVDRSTGEKKKAWKCQRCKKWLTTDH